MTYNDRLIRACYQQEVDRVPVWYMRQAGRYDPEYREIKQKYTLLQICQQPELAAKVTMMPVHKLGVDAAILYSDIMNPVASLGVKFDIVKNVGPVIEKPIRTRADVERLVPIDVNKDLGHIMETIRLLNQMLHVPLITFAGAPFTIASYLIEGRPSKGHLHTKTMMYNEPDVWHLLMDKLAQMIVTYASAQVANGAKVFQMFDSWAGTLTPQHFRTYVLPTIRYIFDQLSHLNVPKIYFPGVSSGELLTQLHDLKVECISLDWRTSIAQGRQRLGGQYAIQGNLDPYVLTAPLDVIKAYAKSIVDEGMVKNGFIFNLGHGLFPEASLQKLKALTQYVHEYSEQAYYIQSQG